MVYDIGSQGAPATGFLKQLRFHERTDVKLMPVIIIADMSDTSLYEKMAYWRISGFLIKTVSEGALKRAVEAALARYRVAPPGQPSSI